MSDDENPRLGESPSDNKFIDEITMKLMSNQSNYAKYLSKTDPLKYAEQQQFITDCGIFKKDILTITNELISSKDNEYGSDVKSTFDNYARTLIRYLEIKQRSDELQKEYIDDDEMFPDSIDETEKPHIPYGKMNTMDYFSKKK
jgi:hypothetical protein